MFFRNHFNGIAETLEIKYKSFLRDGLNSSDIGELCELFVQEFLTDCLDDHYKVYRGGNIVNTTGDRSPQLDIILTNKNALKIFGDKGIYPIETVTGVFSITSNLTIPKLKKCIEGIGKIPKYNYGFSIEKFYGEDFRNKTFKVWKNLMPFICIFGYKGNITETWINEVNKATSKIKDKSLWPSMIIVNKKGMLEKKTEYISEAESKTEYVFTLFDSKEGYGEPFSKMLFHLYNMSGEQSYMRPKYENYFSKDY